MIGRGDPAAIQVWGGPISTPERAPANRVYEAALALPRRGRMAKLIPAALGPDTARNMWPRSDHFVLHNAGVDSVLYLGGLDDRYHTARDDVHSLDLRSLEAVSAHAVRLVAHLAGETSLRWGAHFPQRFASSGYDQSHTEALPAPGH
jgi:hypothetical protein